MMDRATKEQRVSQLNEGFSQTNSLVVIHYKGLSVSDFSDLRSKARESGAAIQVSKNTLTKLALKGTQYESVSELLNGQTAIVTSQDEVAAAKVVVNFGKDNENVVVLGGAIGPTSLDAAGVKSLAAMPSLEESRAKLVGLLQAPASKLLQVLQAPAGQVARVIGAKAQAGE